MSAAAERRLDALAAELATARVALDAAAEHLSELRIADRDDRQTTAGESGAR